MAMHIRAFICLFACLLHSDVVSENPADEELIRRAKAAADSKLRPKRRQKRKRSAAQSSSSSSSDSEPGAKRANKVYWEMRNFGMK